MAKRKTTDHGAIFEQEIKTHQSKMRLGSDKTTAGLLHRRGINTATNKPTKESGRDNKGRFTGEE